MENEVLQVLFFRKAEAALAAYQAAVAAKYPSAEAEQRQMQFASLWDLIETARLDQAFEEWKAG